MIRQFRSAFAGKTSRTALQFGLRLGRSVVLMNYLHAAVFSLALVSAMLPGAVARETSEGASAARDDPATVPARFADGLEAAAAQIRFPNYKKDVSIFSYCFAALRVSGKVEWSHCLDYANFDDSRFRSAVARFLETARFSPAIVDGKRVPVVIYSRVFFGRQGEQFAVGLDPNWGQDIDKYGLAYEGPQRPLGEPAFSGCSMGNMTTVLVSSSGHATGEVTFIDTSGFPRLSRACERWITQTLEDGRFIPAWHNGKPVDAVYTEVWGDHYWITLKRPNSQ